MSDGGVPSQRANGSSSGFGTILRVVLFVCLLGVLLYAGTVALHTMQARENQRQTEDSTVQSTGLITPAPKMLASKFTDKQGRLLADPPDSPDQLADPNPIVLAHIGGSDAENPGTDWAEFEAYLARSTGRKVVDRDFDNSADQLAEIGKGNITIVALHAADAPFLVDNYGFQPAAVLGNEGGANGNHLDIIVPASSPMTKPADLKGRSLLCTIPSSITGYRAAVALLMQNEGLRPNVDYFVTWSMGGPKRSIEQIIKAGGDEAAAVSNDKVQSLLAEGTIQKSDFRIIYQSEVIPRTTIGWFYDLKPDLAEKIRQAILTFKPSGSNDQTADSGEGNTSLSTNLHFIPIDYKKDFQLVRTIDDSFDPRLDAKAKASHPTTEPSDSQG
jgi:phosphonate transport system substrate-binding protein